MENDINETLPTNSYDNVVEDGGLAVLVTDSFQETDAGSENANESNTITG